MLNNKLLEGEEAFKKSIELYEGLDNYSKELKSFPLTNLGLSYWLQRRHEEATIVLLGALQDREEIFGPMDQESLKFVHDLNLL
jgi:hypothetical protein